MRTTKLIKFTIFLLLIYILATSFAFAYDESTALPAAYFNIQSFSYKPVITNTETNFAEAITVKSVKAIELTQLSNRTTSDESLHAIPQISIANRTATLSASSSQSTNCTLLAKVSVNYENRGEYTAWFELAELKTYIYRRTYVDDIATDFTVTLYYILDNPENLPDTSGGTAQLLSLDTGGSTNFYFFYLFGITEEVYYSGTLTENIVNVTTPENTDGTFLLVVDVAKPASWTNTGFFDNIGFNNLTWIISLQAGLNPPSSAPDNTNYVVGLTFDSLNDYKLISTDSGSGMGVSNVPYTLRLRKNSSQIIDFDRDKPIRIENINSQEIRDFYIYTYSNFTNLETLNAGTYKDTIYINFVTDIDSNYGDTTIQVF